MQVLTDDVRCLILTDLAALVRLLDLTPTSTPTETRVLLARVTWAHCVEKRRAFKDAPVRFQAPWECQEDDDVCRRRAVHLCECILRDQWDIGFAPPVCSVHAHSDTHCGGMFDAIVRARKRATVVLDADDEHVRRLCRLAARQPARLGALSMQKTPLDVVRSRMEHLDVVGLPTKKPPVGITPGRNYFLVPPLSADHRGMEPNEDPTRLARRISTHFLCYLCAHATGRDMNTLWSYERGMLRFVLYDTCGVVQMCTRAFARKLWYHGRVDVLRSLLQHLTIDPNVFFELERNGDRAGLQQYLRVCYVEALQFVEHVYANAPALGVAPFLWWNDATKRPVWPLACDPNDYATLMTEETSSFWLAPDRAVWVGSTFDSAIAPRVNIELFHVTTLAWSVQAQLARETCAHTIALSDPVLEPFLMRAMYVPAARLVHHQSSDRMFTWQQMISLGGGLVAVAVGKYPIEVGVPQAIVEYTDTPPLLQAYATAIPRLSWACAGPRGEPHAAFDNAYATRVQAHVESPELRRLSRLVAANAPRAQRLDATASFLGVPADTITLPVHDPYQAHNPARINALDHAYLMWLGNMEDGGTGISIYARADGIEIGVVPLRDAETAAWMCDAMKSASAYAAETEVAHRRATLPLLSHDQHAHLLAGRDPLTGETPLTRWLDIAPGKKIKLHQKIEMVTQGKTANFSSEEIAELHARIASRKMRLEHEPSPLTTAEKQCLASSGIQVAASRSGSRAKRPRPSDDADEAEEAEVAPPKKRTGAVRVITPATSNLAVAYAALGSREMHDDEISPVVERLLHSENPVDVHAEVTALRSGAKWTAATATTVAQPPDPWVERDPATLPAAMWLGRRQRIPLEWNIYYAHKTRHWNDLGNALGTITFDPEQQAVTLQSYSHALLYGQLFPAMTAPLAADAACPICRQIAQPLNPCPCAHAVTPCIVLHRVVSK